MRVNDPYWHFLFLGELLCLRVGLVLLVNTFHSLKYLTECMYPTKRFLSKGSVSGRAMGTLFVIGDGWGYNIQPYSLFPGEVEILVEPERQFRVVSVIPGDLTIISLQMLDTPVILPHVFGSEW